VTGCINLYDINVIIESFSMPDQEAANADDSVLTDDEVVGFHVSLANHGRWGAEDKAGTLNHITPEGRLAAFGLVRTAKQVSCARPVGLVRGALPQRSVLHLMTKSGGDNPDQGHGGCSDWFGIGIHGTEYTHLDAHAHILWDGEMYNHRPKSLIRADTGVLDGGVEPAFHGIVSRGVLWDGPAANGGQPLCPGHAIQPGDLDRWFAGVSIEPRAGDVLFVRTGNSRTDDKEGFAGLSAACMPWLQDHSIAVLATDAISDVVPSEFSMPAPVHSVGIAAMGLWIIDNAALEELSAQCEEESRYEFLTVISPIPLRNATGSLVNPIAIF
jgi:hypothetical protein